MGWGSVGGWGWDVCDRELEAGSSVGGWMDKDTTSVSWAGDPRSFSLWYWQYSFYAWAAAKRERWLHYSDSCRLGGWGAQGVGGPAFSSGWQKCCKRQHFHCEAKLMLISWTARNGYCLHIYSWLWESQESHRCIIYLQRNWQQLLLCLESIDVDTSPTQQMKWCKSFNEQSLRSKHTNLYNRRWYKK